MRSSGPHPAVKYEFMRVFLFLILWSYPTSVCTHNCIGSPCGFYLQVAIQHSQGGERCVSEASQARSCRGPAVRSSMTMRTAEMVRQQLSLSTCVHAFMSRRVELCDLALTWCLLIIRSIFACASRKQTVVSLFFFSHYVWWCGEDGSKYFRTCEAC